MGAVLPRPAARRSGRRCGRLPEASPTGKGAGAGGTLLPELGGDGITAVLPLPQDEGLWENLHLVFATAGGNVRRNKLSDFGRVRSSGIIAMKLDEGDHLIGVATCRDGDDVFLATRLGRCIRFQITDGHAARVHGAGQFGGAGHSARDRGCGDRAFDPAAFGGDERGAGRVAAGEFGAAAEPGRGGGRVGGERYWRGGGGGGAGRFGGAGCGGGVADGDGYRVRQSGRRRSSTG